MGDKEYNLKDFTIYLRKKSQYYRSGGYKNAKLLRRSIPDYLDHMFAFMIDINLCLLPVYIWIVEFLLILCGLLPPNFFNSLYYIMFALLFVTSVILLGLITATTGGKSIGYAFMDLRFVRRKNKREANALILALRQALNIGLPLILIGYFFEIIGIVIWWLLCLLVVLVMPNQQSIFDTLLGIATVRDPDEDLPIPGKKTAPKGKKAAPAREQRTTEARQLSITPIDLHIRSSYSDDGTYSVEEIFKQASQRGMEVISITDHNCARGNAPAVRFAEMYGIQYIPGVEIDSQYQDIRIRVLGYYIDWNSEIFYDLEKESLTREKELSLQRVEKFEEYSGLKIDVEAIMSNSRFQTITDMDITEMAFDNEQVRNLPLIKKYINASRSENEARERFRSETFDQGGPCYVYAAYPDLTRTIQAIHDSGGIAVLSGWHLDFISDEVIEEIVALGIDGIECFGPDMHDETIAALLKIAQKNNLFISCGSDYHGDRHPERQLGVTSCPEKALPLIRILTKGAQ
ncbi:MAG: PHP domain-containing protein [Faecalicoccus sp.]|nr:PHP domain-containing protein [Faecalicoccus sp.]